MTAFCGPQSQLASSWPTRSPPPYAHYTVCALHVSSTFSCVSIFHPSRNTLRLSKSHSIRNARCCIPVRSDGSSFRMSTICPSSVPKKLAILVSGGGRSLENICERIERRMLTGCQVSVVIASKNTAGAIEKAERFGIPTRVVRFKDFERSSERFSDALSVILDEFGVDLVVLAGWMHFYLIPPRYEGKVINIHPSLIPAFCGKGYFGHHVHEAVIDFGAKITGCTVHLADNKYDHGPIILQYAVAVNDTDTADDLADRVFESEKDALPKAIQLFVDGKLSVQGRRVRIRTGSASADV